MDLITEANSEGVKLVIILVFFSYVRKEKSIIAVDVLSQALL